MDKTNLTSTYELLCDEMNYPGKEDKTRRGREFETFLINLLELEGLIPRHYSFRPKGEEVDGSFTYGFQTYLFEAKWHADPLPASSIYQFKGKVDGKLVGTIGIFISMSGFSKDAIDALAYGKTLNVILFDRKDMDWSVITEKGFSVALQAKLRYATERGMPFYAVSSVSLKPAVYHKQTEPKVLGEIVIVVEGQGDQEIISFLAQKILKENNVTRKVTISTAGGKVSIPGLVNAIDDFSDERELKFILIADADSDAKETAAILSRNLNEELTATLVIPDPEIEVWFEQLKIYDREDLKNYARDHNTKPSVARQHLLDRLDIQQLYKSNKSFKEYYDALITT